MFFFFFFIVGSVIGIINSAVLTRINTGLLAEHTVTKIFAHKIWSIGTKKLGADQGEKTRRGGYHTTGLTGRCLDRDA